MMKKRKGFGIRGSRVGGVSKLLFRTKKEALAFTKRVGGKVVMKY